MPKKPRSKPPADKPQRRHKISRDLPPPRKPDNNGFPFARKREVHSHGRVDVEFGYLVNSEPWQTIVGPLGAAIDLARRPPGTRGPKSKFGAQQVLEATIARVLLRCRSLDDTLIALCNNHPTHAAIRQMIGFDHHHEARTDRRIDRTDGVPDKSTVYRIIQNTDLSREQIRDALRSVQHEQTLLLLQVPDVQEASRLLFMDTLRQQTRYTAAHYDAKTKELTNPDNITAPGAGYLAKSSGLKRAGDGFKAPILMARNGIVFLASAIPMDNSEITAGLIAVETFGLHYRPLIRAGRVVLVADGGFASDNLRAAIRQTGVIEIIHDVSHGSDGKKRAEREDKRKLEIAGYPNWHANGHRELHCACGKGRAERQFSNLKDGTAVLRLVGRCATCGTISITSGHWHTVRNNAGFDRIIPGQHPNPTLHEHLDLTFGNPFTYNDPIATDYGKERFGRNEGLIGTLATRFGLFDRPGYYRDAIDFEIDLYAVLCLLHAAALIYYQHGGAVDRAAA